MPAPDKHQTILKRLDSIEEKVDHNNELLIKIRRRDLLSFWFGILKILVIVGVFYWGYVLVEPYIQDFLKSYQSVIDASSAIKGSLPAVEGVPDEIKSLIEKFSN